MSMNKLAFRKNVHVDDWKTKTVIITSGVSNVQTDD